MRPTLRLRQEALRPGLAALMVALASGAGAEPACTTLDRGRVGNDEVRLVRIERAGPAGDFAVFKAPLAVNTDGAPTSYHPDDFLGKRLAINRIDNGIAISTSLGGRVPLQQKMQVFDAWRRSPDWRIPAGFRINWQNVIAADGAGKPCVFRQDNAGYFGSLTALKNGLPAAQAGECSVKDQLDQRFVPAIVLRGASNPMRRWGAKTGDLVLAIHSDTGRSVAAVIGDTGDGNRIGEGSVALNLALLGRTEQPATYAQALALDTGTQQMIVAVVPKSVLFKRERPYTADNLASRVKAWADERHGSLEGFVAAARACSTGI